jgi:TetR/AcrR family transcriptional repressor of nem operon
MSRTREFDPEKALEKAVSLFWDRGFTDTSMDDLVKATGVSRYGFYGSFGSKAKLFEAALKQYAEKMSAKTQGELRRPDAGLKEIRSYFSTLMELVDTDVGKRGCMICNTAVEVAPNDDRIAKIVRALFDDVQKAFQRALENAVKSGDLKIARREIPSQARYLTGIIQALSVMARTGFDRKAMQELVNVSLKNLG